MANCASAPTIENDGARLKLVELRKKSFRDQAIWFLNSCDAGDDPAKCQLVRKIEQKCAELDDGLKEKSSVLNEFMAHRLLEYSNNPCTSNELRAYMETINRDSSARRISLAELLIYQFGYNWTDLVNSPDCLDLVSERRAREELEKAKIELSKLTEAAKNAAKIAEEARQSEGNALREENVATKAAEVSKAAKLSSFKSREKACEALKALNIQEESTKQKKEELERIAADSRLGVVKRNKAIAELSILLSEDPLPLRAARIKQEAAMKKMNAAVKQSDTAVALSEAAHERAMKARNEALKLRESAIKAAKEAENSITAAQNAFDKISNTVEDIARKQKSGRGTIYFIKAELNEQKKFLPKSQFVVAQKRAEEIIKQ